MSRAQDELPRNHKHLTQSTATTIPDIIPQNTATSIMAFPSLISPTVKRNLWQSPINPKVTRLLVFNKRRKAPKSCILNPADRRGRRPEIPWIKRTTTTSTFARGICKVVGLGFRAHGVDLGVKRSNIQEGLALNRHGRVTTWKRGF